MFSIKLNRPAAATAGTLTRTVQPDASSSPQHGLAANCTSLINTVTVYPAFRLFASRILHKVLVFNSALFSYDYAVQAIRILYLFRRHVSAEKNLQILAGTCFL
jgi:hypothetical protein